MLSMWQPHSPYAAITDVWAAENLQESCVQFNRLYCCLILFYTSSGSTVGQHGFTVLKPGSWVFCLSHLIPAWGGFRRFYIWDIVSMKTSTRTFSLNKWQRTDIPRDAEQWNVGRKNKTATACERRRCSVDLCYLAKFCNCCLKWT